MKTGDKISDFTIAATNGDFTLSAAAGKFVVLYFYPKDDTPGCTIEGNDFSKLLPEFEKAGAVVFGVSRDSIKSHNKFIEKFNYAHPLLADTEAQLCEQFSVLKEKNMYGKMVKGISRGTFIISPDAKLAAEWRDIKDVTGHAAEVLERLKTLAG